MTNKNSLLWSCLPSDLSLSISSIYFCSFTTKTFSVREAWIAFLFIQILFRFERNFKLESEKEMSAQKVLWCLMYTVSRGEVVYHETCVLCVSLVSKESLLTEKGSKLQIYLYLSRENHKNIDKKYQQKKKTKQRNSSIDGHTTGMCIVLCYVCMWYPTASSPCYHPKDPGSRENPKLSM